MAEGTSVADAGHANRIGVKARLYVQRTMNSHRDDVFQVHVTLGLESERFSIFSPAYEVD